MHIIKFKSNQIGQVLKHIERPLDRNYGNKNIDLDKTKDNYTLIDGNIDKINDRVNEVKHLNRADIVKLVGVVITIPKDYNGDKNKFFEKIASVFEERYGKDNIAYATVHNDEKTPHMHLGVIPITKDKEGHERLCAKEVFNRTELQKMHPEIEKALNLRLREPVHLINGRTERNPETGKAYKDIDDFKRSKEKEERELPKGLFNKVDYKKAYEQERDKYINEACKAKEMERERNKIEYKLTDKLEKAQRDLKGENELRNELQDRLNDIEQVRQRLRELEREEAKLYEREKQQSKER